MPDKDETVNKWWNLFLLFLGSKNSVLSSWLSAQKKKFFVFVRNVDVEEFCNEDFPFDSILWIRIIQKLNWKYALVPDNTIYVNPELVLSILSVCF